MLSVLSIKNSQAALASGREKKTRFSEFSKKFLSLHSLNSNVLLGYIPRSCIYAWLYPCSENASFWIACNSLNFKAWKHLKILIKKRACITIISVQVRIEHFGVLHGFSLELSNNLQFKFTQSLSSKRAMLLSNDNWLCSGKFPGKLLHRTSIGT